MLCRKVTGREGLLEDPTQSWRGVTRLSLSGDLGCTGTNQTGGAKGDAEHSKQTIMADPDPQALGRELHTSREEEATRVAGAQSRVIG